MDGRRTACRLRMPEGFWRAHPAVQDLLDLRFVADRRVDRPRGRHRRGADARALVADGRRCAAAQALPGIRQPVCRGRWRRPPARPPPDDVAPPGHADGRGRPASSLGAADLAPHRVDRPSAVAIGAGQRQARRAGGRRRAGAAARRGRRGHAGRGRQAGLARPWRGLVQRLIVRPAVRAGSALAIAGLAERSAVAARGGPGRRDRGRQRQLLASHRRANRLGARQWLSTRAARHRQPAGRTDA